MRPPAKLLLDPGTIVLEDGAGDEVELAPGTKIALRWDGATGREDSTTTAGRVELVPATIIEANATAIRLRSESWKKPEDLPAEYLASPDLNVNLRSGRYDKPVVTIRTEHVTRIVVYEKHREPFGAPGLVQTGKWIWSGAAGGGLLLMGMVAKNNIADPHGDGVDALIVMAGAAAGAVVYPVYKVMKPNYTRVGTSYASGDGGYQLRLSKGARSRIGGR